jgi:hypothetical protein
MKAYVRKRTYPSGRIAWLLTRELGENRDGSRDRVQGCGAALPATRDDDQDGAGDGGVCAKGVEAAGSAGETGSGLATAGSPLVQSERFSLRTRRCEEQQTEEAGEHAAGRDQGEALCAHRPLVGGVMAMVARWREVEGRECD